MKRKKIILLVVLLMTVGFAAVSTTLYINGSTNISANPDDFSVYFSDAKVNGTQDLSVVVSETELSFTTELSTLGETYVLDYDVTNGSKNYDAKLTMNCTGGNEYLTVSNAFDTATNLEALKTRSGKLTLELTKSYTGDDQEVTIACEINANAVERNALGEGTVNESIGDNYGIGRLIVIGDERFNVISQTEDTVTMLAQYNLGPNYKQTTVANPVSFSNSSGWEYTPGPKEIDIQVYDGNAKTYVNEYVSYLEGETGKDLSGNLITFSELMMLGCSGDATYEYIPLSNGYSCENSTYADWLFNGQSWHTRSANSTFGIPWYVTENSKVASAFMLKANAGVRPVITISKSALR